MNRSADDLGRYLAITLILSFAALQARSQDAPQNDPAAPTDPAIVRAATLQAEQGGTGPYKAMMTADSGLYTHTIYRPADLSGFGGDDLLPIVVWGNGACANIGNRFRYFLTEIASHGYFIAAIGPIGPQFVEGNVSTTPPGEEAPPPVDPADRTAPSSWTQLIDAMDWAIAENGRQGGIYYGKLDPGRIAVMGQSCGGLQAIRASADPRTTASGIWNSGTFPDDANMILPGAEASKASLKDLHAPVAFITGDESDVAFNNSNADFALIDHVPALRAYRKGLGHSRHYRAPGGGPFAAVAVAWLDWQLKGDEEARHWFVGDDCRLCRDPDWFIDTKNFGAAVAAEPDEATDFSDTGWASKRPVLASACVQACPWGELGDFVRDAMAPLGYDVILCRNCNRDRGPRLVATAGMPPPLGETDVAHGTVRVTAPVDFGITAAGFLAGGYHGDYPKLRLIARIEDPMYLLVAVTKASGITDLADVATKEMPVRVLAGEGADDVLAYYGLTRERIEAFGGSFGGSMGQEADAEFDIIIDSLGSSAMNPESWQWTRLSMARELVFLSLPQPLIDELAARRDYQPVTVKWGYLRGVNHELATVGRTGEVVFARADTPDDAAYDIARALDAARGGLKWYVRPYAIDPRTVWHSQDVPLHPGAERYYREAGYLPAEAGKMD